MTETATSPRLRGLLVGVTVLTTLAAFAVTQGAPAAVAAAGPELARLIRMMTVLKLAFVAAGLALVVWRLRFPASRHLASGYALGCILMAAGPGLIWNMAHIVAGAILLHGGLGMLVVLGCVDGLPSQALTQGLGRRQRPASPAVPDRAAVPAR